jgi:hypothetical protein
LRQPQQSALDATAVQRLRIGHYIGGGWEWAQHFNSRL